MLRDDAVEAEVIAKGLNRAPRLRPDQIDAVITGEDYHVFSGRLTVCCLTLKNGFLVTGESSCVSPENFDAELGRKLARDQARDKIWMLEGYLLRQQMLTQPGRPVNCPGSGGLAQVSLISETGICHHCGARFAREQLIEGKIGRLVVPLHEQLR